MTRPLTLTVLPGSYAICRLDPGAPLPPLNSSASALTSVTRTARELSIVCPVGEAPAGAAVEAPWTAIAVAGQLDFALVGILAGLTAPLAAAGISVFAVSTFDTDHLLVREADRDHAVATLEAAGHRFES